jgi:hypothetical protein
MNLSNTHLMTAGAAHGQGIYTANHSSTSFGYCASRAGIQDGLIWKPNKCNNNTIMAVVECIKEPSFLKPGQSFDNKSAYGVFVIPKENHIRMRYMFFNTPNHRGTLDSHLVDFQQHYYAFIEEH